MIENPEASLLKLSKDINPVDSKNAVIFTAGNTGYDFFDVAKLTMSPKTSEKVVDIYEELISQVKKNENIDFNKLAFIDSTLAPLMISSQLIQRTEKDAIIIKAKVSCDCNLCLSKLRIKASNSINEPPVDKNDNVIIVSDVLSTGGTLQKAIQIIESFEAKVIAAVVIVDRQVHDENGKTAKVLLEEKNKNFRLVSFVTRDRLLAWGFSEPTMGDLKNRDFFDIIKSSLEVSDAKLIESHEKFIKKFVDNAIKNRKDKDISSDRKIMENMVITLLSHSFTKQAMHVK